MFIKNTPSAMIAAALVSCSLLTPAFADNSSKTALQNTNIQTVLTKPGEFMGKKITLNGKVERILSSNSFVMSSNDDSSQRILVLTANSAQNDAKKEKAGVAGPALKDDQKVQVTGKLDVLTVRTETDTVNPRKDTATFSQMTTNTPVVVVQPSGIQKQS